MISFTVALEYTLFYYSERYHKILASCSYFCSDSYLPISFIPSHFLHHALRMAFVNGCLILNILPLVNWK